MQFVQTETNQGLALSGGTAKCRADLLNCNRLACLFFRHRLVSSRSAALPAGLLAGSFAAAAAAAGDF